MEIQALEDPVASLRSPIVLSIGDILQLRFSACADSIKVHFGLEHMLLVVIVKFQASDIALREYILYETVHTT